MPDDVLERQSEDTNFAAAPVTIPRCGRDNFVAGPDFCRFVHPRAVPGRNTSQDAPTVGDVRGEFVVRNPRTATTIAAFAAAAALGLAACSSDSGTATTTSTAAASSSAAESSSSAPASSSSAAAGTIVGVASGNPDFSTLVSAVSAAGLVETLNGPGPFTVFAPTNAAFAALPAGLLDKLLLPANKATLTKILTYHVLPAEVMAADVKAGKVKTVEGTELTITTEGGVKVDTANVTATDVDASNGVIHVIDKVLVPAGVDVASL
jgi:uncharacterized surface protein with fasciclin (FAS1) repeats